jgi:hypothetical protein
MSARTIGAGGQGDRLRNVPNGMATYNDYQEQFIHAIRFRSFTEDSMMLLTESLGIEGFNLAVNCQGRLLVHSARTVLKLEIILVCIVIGESSVEFLLSLPWVRMRFKTGLLRDCKGPGKSI